MTHIDFSENDAAVKAARDAARAEIKRRILCTDYLTKSKGKDMYCCPFCGSGTGANATGALKYYPDTNTVCCFGRCDRKQYDVIDLYQQTTGTDYNTALQALADMIGVSLKPTQSGAERQKQQNHAGIHFDSNNDAVPKETANYSEYYKQCASRITNKDAAYYLKDRGISLVTAVKCGIGFDPEADPANAPGAIYAEEYRAHPAPRIIIPTASNHYVARSIDPHTEAAYRVMNPNTSKGAGSPGIFMKNYLHDPNAHEVFVTEGWANAASIIEAGAAAIALNSAGNTALLLKELAEHPTAATLILALDNDEAGRKATAELEAGLLQLNVSCIHADKRIIGSGDTVKDRNGKAGKEDANDLLVADREAFIDAVQAAQHQTAARPDNISYYISNLMSGDISRFRQEIKTGFSNLDKESGGVYAGLYVIAAISSLGKTTFAAQIADNMAAAGNEVLFFSMEQSRLEMVSKSINRKCFLNDRQTRASSLSIRKGNLTQEVMTAANQYVQEVQERISVIEGNMGCDISFIGNYIRDYIRKNKCRPVIFIDYLQVLQPGQQNGKQQTTKESVDYSVTELKKLSRELELPIFVISSVNRSNYLTPIDFESLKESGNIEYTADVIWGLQLQCLNDKKFDSESKAGIKEKRDLIKKAKKKNPREIELVCLKNRYGIANFSCNFKFFARNDYFEADGYSNPEQ